jgi:4-amino-4-deoxy-L-arabinose transferase-like glycosyltransferase
MAHRMGQALPPRGTALLLALAAGLLVFRLGAVPLLGPDEPRYARVAVEMHRAGEWVRPTLAGEPWLEKPPLYYWLAGAAFSLFGETETAARLPSVLAALGLVGVTALVGARLFGGTAGLHAGFVLATALLPFAYGRAAAMDMLLAATVTAAIGLLALRALGIAGRLAVPAAFVFMALATLAKGPLGLLLPALVAGAYIVASRDGRFARALLSPVGIVLFLLVAGPWYAAILHDQGRRFVDVFLLSHNFERFTSTVHNHPGPPFYYVPILLVGLFPWSGLLLPALGGLAPFRRSADRFVLLWFLLPFLFFSAAGSKLPGYILPALPPLALLIGRAVAALAAGDPPRRVWAGPRAVALLTLVLGSLLATVPAFLAREREADRTVALPFAVWCVIVGLGFWRRVGQDAAGAVRLLRVGGAGALLLLTLAAPPILARRESGKRLFGPARGREVLAWGAWRTAWMAGYFYNDGHVREVPGVSEIMAALDRGPTLALVGPGERRQLENTLAVVVHPLAEGPRQNALLRLERR